MKEKMTDVHLVQAYNAGEKTAFDILFAKYEKPLFSFIMRFVGNRQTAEDLFQQTWLKVIKGLAKYKEQDKFASWLFGIANNCCIDFLRKAAHSKLDDTASVEGLEHILCEDVGPESSLIYEETVALLEKAIAQLSHDQKQVVLLRIHGDLPFKEIAQLLQCPLNTVLGRMHYAIHNLCKIMHNQYNEVSKNVMS